MKIQLTVNNNKPFHKDLHVCVPEINLDVHIDTYYFLIDEGMLPEKETEEKIAIILKYLLQDWAYNVDNLADGETTFLPCDFSDQYLGALKVHRHKQMPTIRNAWNQELGGMYPSYCGKINMIDENLNVLIGKMEIYIDKLIHDIEKQIMNVDNLYYLL